MIYTPRFIARCEGDSALAYPELQAGLSASPGSKTMPTSALDDWNSRGTFKRSREKPE
jgi:hypothetical protein